MCIQNFLDGLDHLNSHFKSLDDVETTTLRPLGSHDHLKRGILSGLREIVVPIFGDGSSGRYCWARTDKIKKNLHVLQQSENLQGQEIQDKYAPINLTRVELGDHRKLLHTMDLTLV